MVNNDVLVVRNINKQIYKKLKQKAVEEDISVGTALNEAIEYWLNAKTSRKRPNPKNFLKIKPVDFGEGSENLSLNIDEMLYWQVGK